MRALAGGEFAALNARDMRYDRQTSAEGRQNPRLDAAPSPLRGIFKRRGDRDLVGIVARLGSASAIMLGGARRMLALRGVANVMVAGLFATEASYEDRAVQRLARPSPDGRPVRHTRPAEARGRARGKIVQPILGDTRR